jgi:hypothetical protein
MRALWDKVQCSLFGVDRRFRGGTASIIRVTNEPYSCFTAIERTKRMPKRHPLLCHYLFNNGWRRSSLADGLVDRIATYKSRFTPCDFFLLGWVKSGVYNNRHTIKWKPKQRSFSADPRDFLQTAADSAVLQFDCTNVSEVECTCGVVWYSKLHHMEWHTVKYNILKNVSNSHNVSAFIIETKKEVNSDISFSDIKHQQSHCPSTTSLLSSNAYFFLAIVFFWKLNHYSKPSSNSGYISSKIGKRRDLWISVGRS